MTTGLLRSELRKITFVEKDPAGVEQIRDALRQIKEDKSIPELDLRITADVRKRPEPAIRVHGRDPLDALPQTDPGVRLTITRTDDEFEFSAKMPKGPRNRRSEVRCRE